MQTERAIPSLSRGNATAASREAVTPQFSVIVPAWNEARTLPALLDSLRQQTVKEFEVLVADSGSTDGTEAVARSFGAYYLSGERKGPAEGRNRGAREASADTLVFVDADCVVPGDLLERIQDCLADRSVVGGATLFRPADGSLGERVLFFFANAYQRAMISWGFPHNAGFCFFFRRSAFERLQGLREDLFLNETHDIALRSRSLGRFVSLPVAVSTSMRRFRKNGFARTVFHEYLGSTLLYYVARRPPPDSFRPEPVR